MSRCSGRHGVPPVRTSPGQDSPPPGSRRGGRLPDRTAIPGPPVMGVELPHGGGSPVLRRGTAVSARPGRPLSGPRRAVLRILGVQRPVLGPFWGPKNGLFLASCGAKPRGSGGAPPTNLILLRNQWRCAPVSPSLPRAGTPAPSAAPAPAPARRSVVVGGGGGVRTGSLRGSCGAEFLRPARNAQLRLRKLRLRPH